jgi:hypothetical protein
MTRTAPLVRASLNARPLFSLTLAQQVKERRNLQNRNPGIAAQRKDVACVAGDDVVAFCRDGALRTRLSEGSALMTSTVCAGVTWFV